MGIALLALGRAGSARDLRAVELGLRARSMADVGNEFLEGLAPFLEQSGLVMPDAEMLGFELPWTTAGQDAESPA